MYLAIVIAWSFGFFFLRWTQWYLFLGRRFGKKYLAYADTWWFLNESRNIRKAHFKLSGKFRKDRLDYDNHYPPLFLYLLAVIPEKYLDYVIKYAVVFMDALIASTLFFSVAFITNSVEYGILGTLVYFASPMIFQQHFCLCVRPLTIFSVSIIYLLSCSFSVLNFLILSVLIAIILLLHKFAAQVVIFTSLAFLIFGRIEYFAAVIAGFVIAMLASKGYYLKVLKGHVNKLRSSDLKQFAHSRAKNSLERTAVLLVYCPWLAFFVLSVFVLGWSIFSPLLICSTVWIMTLLAFSVVTNFWIFRIIGEGWRYLGYLVFPIAFYAVSVIGYSHALLWMYAFFAVLGLGINYYYAQRLFRAHEKFLVDREDIEAFKKISSIKGDKLVAFPNEFTNVAVYFAEKFTVDYTPKIEFTDIAVVNKELTENSLYKKLEDSGYAVRFEDKRWAAYTR